MADNIIRGLDAILSGGGGADFITFKENSPMVLLFIDWGQDLMGIREHYEPGLKPSYVRCPGTDICPLCIANPSAYPALRMKFRVYDPVAGKIKFVSLAKKHIQSITRDLNIDETDPTVTYVTISRFGRGASDTSYSARTYHPNGTNRPDYERPSQRVLDDMPDIMSQLRAHTPDQIRGFQQSFVDGVDTSSSQGSQSGQSANYNQNQGQTQASQSGDQGQSSNTQQAQSDIQDRPVVNNRDDLPF